MSTLPPAFIAGALYDSLLQGALRQFFSHAALESEATPSISSDGKLAIEPTRDPTALAVRWFGSRHTLRTRGSARTFTAHEVRFARAIGSVLAARYRAIFDTRLMAERSDLFRGLIEDRYIGAFLDEMPYAIQTAQSRADRIASAIEVLRVAALSSYENRPISSGVLLLDTDVDERQSERPRFDGTQAYSQDLTAVKGFYRLCDGTRTVFLVNRNGLLLDIVDIRRWAAEAPGPTRAVPCAEAYLAHAAATAGSRHVCIVLSPSHEIKVFAEGFQAFTYRHANWHLLDLEAKYQQWVAAVGHPALAERLFQTALNLVDARQGALFVMLRDPRSAVPHLISPSDRLDAAAMDTEKLPSSSRRDLLNLIERQTAIGIDPTVLAALATMDGATVVDREGQLLAVGAILRHPLTPGESHPGIVEGARTTAAIAASRFGPVLKVSEDGVITFFDQEKIWDI